MLEIFSAQAPSEPHPLTAAATQIVRSDHHKPKPPSVLEQLAAIPEEEIWLAKQKSARTRRAYRLDVRHFMVTLGIATNDEPRQVDHRAVIAWERAMREVEHAPRPRPSRRRLSAVQPVQAPGPPRARRQKPGARD